MPSKKKKYNARFPAGRIKKIMQSDEEIGKVAQAVPVIISRTLELFVESLLHKTLRITSSRNAKTLSTSHMKQCIMAEHRFDFLRELVKNIPDINIAEESAIYNEDEPQSSPEERNYPDSDTPYDLSMPSFSMEATRSVTTGDLQKFWEKSSNHMALSSRALTQENQLLPYLSEMRALSTVNTSAAVPDVMVLAEKTAQTYERKIAQKKQFRAHLVSETVLEQHSPKATPAMPTSAQSDKSVLTRDDILVKDMAKLTSLNDLVVANAKMSAHETTRKHVRQRKTSQNIATSDSSVISQTILLSNNTQICLPLKLCGNNSATTGATCSSGFIQLHGSQSTAKRLNSDQQDRQLLKKESKLILSTNASTDKNYSPTTQPTLPPVPAHILSFDFYNKPVLKIDYSSLSVSANLTTSTIKPLSAPSKVSISSEENKAEYSNFSPEPIFNIDLSNIVTSDNKMSNQPPVAKISIGTIAAIPSISSNLGAASTNLQNKVSMKTNPEASYTSTSEQSPYAIFAERASQSALKNNSFFELDEDYDNI